MITIPLTFAVVAGLIIAWFLSFLVAMRTKDHFSFIYVALLSALIGFGYGMASADTPSHPQPLIIPAGNIKTNSFTVAVGITETNLESTTTNDLREKYK